MIYAYAYIDPNPFLQAGPIAVRALDLGRAARRPGRDDHLRSFFKADVFREASRALFRESFLRSLTFNEDTKP